MYRGIQILITLTFSEFPLTTSFSLSSCIHGEILATIRLVHSETLMILSLLVTGPGRLNVGRKSSLLLRGWTMGTAMKSNLNWSLLSVKWYYSARFHLGILAPCAWASPPLGLFNFLVWQNPWAYIFRGQKVHWQYSLGAMPPLPPPWRHTVMHMCIKETSW